MNDRRDDFDARADEFLLGWLPEGTPQEYHDLLMVILLAVRAKIAERDQPPLLEGDKSS